MIYLDNNTFQQEIFIPRSSAKNDASPDYATKTELENAIENEVIRADGKYATKTDLLPYATTGWVESQDFATKEWTEEQIQSAITSETERTEETYQKISEMSAYSTTNEVESMIDDAVSGKMDTSAITAYSTTEEVENMISAATDGLASEEWVNGQGFLKEHQSLSAYSTTEQMNQAIGSATAATTGWVASQGYITEHQSLSAYTPTSGFSTINGSAITEGGNIVIQGGGAEYSAGTNIEITEDNVINVTGITVPTKVSELQNDSGYITTADTQNFVTSGDVQTQINESISGKADSSAVTAQISDVKQEIEAEIPSKVSDLENDLNFASTGWVSEQGYLTTADTQNFVTSGDVKTQIEGYNYINSGDAQTQIENSISGKVDTSALTEYYTSAETNTAISNATSAFTTSADVKTQIEAYNYVNSGDVQSQINDSISGKVDTSAMTAYWTSAETESAITSATSGLQETLVSGTNIKTINNESILGSGNIVISGGSGSANIIELTQAEYDALTAYTQDAMYVITDAQEINMDNYATTGDIQTALNSYYTSAETDTAISNAVSGKTDKVSVAASSSGYKFPTWNDQGCITGYTQQVYNRNFAVNGVLKTMVQATNSDLPAIYAPTSAGSEGQPLLSNGSGAPVWGSYKFQFLSQSQYDALATKDSTTIYFIVNEN